MTKGELVRALRSLKWSSRAAELGIAQDFKCIYCDRDLLYSIVDYDCWTEDHIQPTSKGGEQDAADNLVIACKLCNFVKGNHPPAGATRDERIADARKHIQKGLATKQNTLARIVEHVTAYRAGNRDL
jgi:5-methylcytosine-specific restriction endonuclease McrA